MAENDIERWRAAFPILQTSTYLISNSLGAMPEAAKAGLQRYLELWSERGVRSWSEEWWTLGDELADAIAPLLGAAPGSVSMQPNVSLATALILSALEGHRNSNAFSGKKIVTTDLQFPSVLYVLQRWCDRQHVDLEVVSADGPFGASTEHLTAAIDHDTLAVAISHVEFKTAWIHDAHAIADHCRKHNAFLLLDVFQSAGILPLDLAAWGVDAAVGGCLKWLCGGPGNAFLYVSPERAADLEPVLTGWMAHPRPFAFEPPPIDQVEGRRRFLHGTPPIPAFYAARPGIDILNSVGSRVLRERSLVLTDLLLAGIAQRGWKVASPQEPSRRGGTVSLDLPNAEFISHELNERNIVVDYRPGVGIRISPHFYNDPADCESCLEGIEQIVKDESWKRHTTVHGESPT